MANRPKPQRAFSKLNRVIAKTDIAAVTGKTLSKKDAKKADVAGRKVQAVWDKNVPYMKKRADETVGTKRDPNKGRVFGKPTGKAPVKSPQSAKAMGNQTKSSPIAKKKVK